MKAFRLFAPVAVLLFAVAGMAFADVQTDYDKSADFSHYKTYSWGKVKTTDPLWQQRVIDAVDRALQAKGMQKVDQGGDLIVTAVGATKDQKEYRTFYDGFGPGWGWWGLGPETATTTVDNYQVGTLVVDMYDGQTHRLVWRGSASDTLASKPEKNEKKLEKDVSKMFDHFPPKGKEGKG